MFLFYLCPREESNVKGVGETSVSPWRKAWENRGFPRSEIAKRPHEGTIKNTPLMWGIFYGALVARRLRALREESKDGVCFV